jgi:uncharacterized protein
LPETDHARESREEWWYTMATHETHAIELIDDTRLNVASLLLEEVGSTRDVEISLATFPLDGDLTASDVHAQFRLTRLRSGLLAKGTIKGTVELECARCLNPYGQPFAESFTEQFRQTVDVRSGADIPPAKRMADDDDTDDEVGFTIDEAHQLDLAEMLRQWIVLALPMRPDCGEDCPGPPEMQNEPEAQVDSRFAELEHLLDDE